MGKEPARDPFPQVVTLRDNGQAMALRPWNHNIHYYDFVLRLAAPGCARALEVGCGQGLLARRLAKRCEEVIAIDIDSNVISRTGAGSGLEATIRFVEGDVLTYPFLDD